MVTGRKGNTNNSSKGIRELERRKATSPLIKRTARCFERLVGRETFWSSSRDNQPPGKKEKRGGAINGPSDRSKVEEGRAGEPSRALGGGVMLGLLSTNHLDRRKKALT